MQTIGIKGGRTYNPYVYSEQGVAMITSALTLIARFYKPLIPNVRTGATEKGAPMSRYLHSKRYKTLYITKVPVLNSKSRMSPIA